MKSHASARSSRPRPAVPGRTRDTSTDIGYVIVVAMLGVLLWRAWEGYAVPALSAVWATAGRWLESVAGPAEPVDVLTVVIAVIPGVFALFAAPTWWRRRKARRAGYRPADDLFASGHTQPPNR